MSYKQNSSRLRRLPDFFGITDSSGLIPLSQIRDNGVINNGKKQPEDVRPSVAEQLHTPCKPGQHKPAHPSRGESR